MRSNSSDGSVKTMEVESDGYVKMEPADRREVTIIYGSDIAERLAIEHWETYVRKIVEAHESDPSVVEKVGVHYVLTFTHGYKHGFEAKENQGSRGKMT